MRSYLSILLLIFLVDVLPAWAEPEEINNNGCRDCHRFSIKEKQLNKGPDLFYSGDKFHKNWLQKFLQSPALIHEMNFSSGLGFLEEKSKENQLHIALTKDETERVVGFLMKLRLPKLEVGKVTDEPLSKGEHARAKILFERSLGCISCHRALNLAGKVRGGVSGPSLINSSQRLKSDWIFYWLKTPKIFMYEGRMPVFNLDEETAVLITKYILSIRSNF
jgi:hypothetical protein